MLSLILGVGCLFEDSKIINSLGVALIALSVASIWLT